MTPHQRPLLTPEPRGTQPSTDDDHPAMVADCQKRAAQLTQWESEFINSLHNQLTRGRRLSPRQAERLDEVWERVTA